MIFTFELGESEGIITPRHGERSQGIMAFTDENGQNHYFKEGRISPRFADKIDLPIDSWIVPVEEDGNINEGLKVVRAKLAAGFTIEAARTPFNIGNGGVDPDDYEDPLFIEGPATITSGLQSELYKS